MKTTNQNKKTMSEKKIILCVDDRYPEAYAAADEGTLEARLREIYKGTEDKYELEFVSNLEDYNKILRGASKNRIALVLLDHDLGFKEGLIHGPWIAKDLYETKGRTDIKVIGLTVKGRKESKFGHLANVVDCVKKTELIDKSEYLRYVSEAIIEDYYNTQWDVTFDAVKGLLVLQKKGGVPYECLIGNGAVSHVLIWCLRIAGQWAGPFWIGDIVGKATDEINSAVRQATGGRAWGIMTTENSPVRCVKVLADYKNVKINYCPAPPRFRKTNTAEESQARVKDLEMQLKKVVEDVDGLKRTLSCATQSFKSEVFEMYRQILAALSDLHGG